jgi:hypothetical protein
MFEPLNPAVSAPIALLIASACLWGLWRGVATSRKVLLALLAVLIIAVVGSYINYAMTRHGIGPLAMLGGVALMLALGLIGPALFRNRIAAMTLSAMFVAFWVLAGTGAYVFGACVLFGICI